MRPKLIIVVCIILFIWLEPATARTYRWVDENGTTIYSQSPPPTGKATIIKPPPPPPPASEPSETVKKLRARLKASDEGKKKQGEAKEKEEKEAKNAEIKKQNCENAKKNLASLKQHSRIKKKMADGNYKILSEEERTADINQAKKNIDKYCK